MSVVSVHNKVFNHDAQVSGFEPSTHVDLGIDFKRLITSEANSYILEGIRGTEKTHILKMVISEIQDNFPNYKVLPCLVTITAAPEIAKIDPKFFRIFLYTSIIKNVCKFIVENKELLIPIENITMLRRLMNLFMIDSKEKKINEDIEYIRKLANSIFQELFDNPDKVVRRMNQKQNFASEVGMDIAPISINSSNTTTEEDEQIKEYTSQKLSDIYGVDVLISFLKTVKDLFNLNYVYLLLDECSESTPLMQKEVFRLGKQIRASCSNSGGSLNKPDISFIIAVYPPQSTYYPSIKKGDDFNFEPGHDCSPEYLEIDELNDEFESFFLELMKNRLKLNNEGPYGLEEVFENEEVILIAAYCSGGVPRRFLEIIKQAYNQLNRDFANKKTDSPKKIDTPYVISAVGQVIESSSLLNSGSLTEEDKIAFEKVIKKFAQRNKSVETKNKNITDAAEKTPITIYFTTAAKSSEEIANLITVGIVHDKKRSRSRKSSISAWQGSGMLCSIDIGAAVHRGVLPKSPSQILEICRRDLKEAAHRGFTYVLDIRLEEESLDIEMEQIVDYIKFLENRLLDLDKALLDRTIEPSVYDSISKRTAALLEQYKRKSARLKEKIDSRLR